MLSPLEHTCAACQVEVYEDHPRRLPSKSLHRTLSVCDLKVSTVAQQRLQALLEHSLRLRACDVPQVVAVDVVAGDHRRQVIQRRLPTSNCLQETADLGSL